MNVAPTVTAGADQTVTVGSPVTVTAVFTDPGVIDTHTATVDWGDGSPLAPAIVAGYGVTASHTYTSTGGSPYTVTLCVEDNDGDEGCDTLTITVTNEPPVADAGNDQIVIVNQPVTLDGSGSDDPDGHLPLSYGWTQTGGPSVTLSDSGAVMPTFTTPGSPAVLTFSLTVTDSFGLASLPDSVTITVVDEGIGGLTAANSSPTTLGQTTFFTTSVSSGSNVSYAWNFGDGNGNSGATVSHIYGAAGVYTTVVTATNQSGSLTASTIVTITNLAPIADAGPDQTTEVNQLVTLDGSGSFDPDGHLSLTYGWAQIGVPPVTLDGSGNVTATFTAPASRTVLTFTLTVTDSYGLAGVPAIVVVTVQQPEIAIEKQVNSTTAAVGETITYTYSLTNTGDVALSGVNPVDDHLGPLFTEPITLPAGISVGQILTYTIVESDLPGPLLNTVVATATSPAGNLVNDSAMAAVILSSQPAIHVIKTANVDSAGVGEVITYTYTVMNVGDVTLTGVTAVDTPLGPVPLLTGTLASLTTTTGVLTYTVTEADLPGPLTNNVLAGGLPPAGEMVTATADLSIDLTGQPGLVVALTANPLLARPGDTITYTIALLNSGDVTLHDVSGTVTVGAVTLPEVLAVGESVMVEYTYTVVAGDLPGPLVNELVVTAVPTAHEPITVTTAVSVTLEPHTLYLPFMLNQFTVAPDLVVHDLLVSEDGVTVVIGNVGNTAVITPFWVDVYFDPDPAPTAVNQTWQMLSEEGLAWGVDIPLLPGETLTLTIGDAYFVPDESDFSGTIGAGTPVYVQVDSADAGSDYGAVLEIDEILGLPYNNILGPVFITEPIILTTDLWQSRSDRTINLPARPAAG